MKIKVGIFFGGPGRKREQSFAGGRMAYEYLDRALFDPVPIWVTSRLDFVMLDWSFLYKDSIRHFFPPLEALPYSPNAFQVYEESMGDLSEEEWHPYLSQVGRRLTSSELPHWISLALLTISSRFGADGQLQQILTEQQIPFTGSDTAVCRSLFDRAAQKNLLADGNIPTPRWKSISREEWTDQHPEQYYQTIAEGLGFPLFIRPAHQPVPVGASLIEKDNSPEVFAEAIDRAFFRERISASTWRNAGDYEKIDHLKLLTDTEYSLGFPLDVARITERATFHHPEELLKYLEAAADPAETPEDTFLLESRYREAEVILQAHSDGLPFSCVVLRNEDGRVMALPPVDRPYDKELLGHVRSASIETLAAERLEQIRSQCVAAFEQLSIQGYGRIDGYAADDGQILISEACLTPVFDTRAILFRQMAAMGLTPTQTLTFMLRTALQERHHNWPEAAALLTLSDLLDQHLHKAGDFQTKKIAVLMGGDTSDKTLPVKQGSYIFERLAASSEYDPIPFFITGTESGAPLFQLPLSFLSCKDSDDLQRALKEGHSSPSLNALRQSFESVIRKYASADVVNEPFQTSLPGLREWVDGVWIAVCGRPAADGTLQEQLEELGLPFNGSRHPALKVAYNHYRSLEVLAKNGLNVPKQALVRKSDFLNNPEPLIEEIESELGYPLLAMTNDEQPVAFKHTINNRRQLEAYCRLLFREEGHEELENRYPLKVRSYDIVPRKNEIHFQAQVRSEGAAQLLKIQGGAITQHDKEHRIYYEIFSPSEILTKQDILTQKELYLLGAGTCITPARFASNARELRSAKRQVKQSLETALRILRLEGLSALEGYVRLWPNGEVETLISNVQASPVLAEANCLRQQAVFQGYAPLQLLEHQLHYAEERRRGSTPANESDPLDASEARTVTAEEASSADAQLTGAATLTSLSASNKGISIMEWLRDKFTKLWAFLKSPLFLRNIAALLGFMLLFFLLLNFLLDQYTHHGESLQVHKYEGMNIEEAVKKARSRSFKIVISDSVFLVDQEPNIVLEQTPKPFSRVKENRRIYVTVTSGTAPEVLLPKLEGAYNYNAYRRRLIALGVKPTIRDRRFNNKLEENTILYFYYKGDRITEEDLQQGVKVPKGSNLEFVVTERLTEEVAAPDLLCMRFEEASWVITNYELLVGEIVGNVSNQDNAFVYRQEPAPGQMISKGSQINVYLTTSRPEDCGE